MPRALVVDDSRLSRLVTRFTLEQAGWSAVEAPDLHTARALLDRSRMDAVFVDRWLPEGDALTWMGWLRSASPSTRFVLLTGDLDDRVVRRATASGAEAWMKPLRRDQVALSLAS